MNSYKEDKRSIESLLLCGSLIDINGKCIKTRKVFSKATTILFYFSASWCTAFEYLLPKLKEINEQNIKRKMRMVIIYVSLDESQKEMMQHFKEKHGNWYTIPFGDIAIKYGITSIPHIIVIKRDGTIVSANAKPEIDKHGINVLVKWTD